MLSVSGDSAILVSECDGELGLRVEATERDKKGLRYREMINNYRPQIHTR